MVRMTSRLFNKMREVISTKYSTLKLSKPADHVVLVELNRPEKRNAMNKAMWTDIRECFHDLSTDPECRVVVLTGAGPHSFTAGIDLQEVISLGSDIQKEEDVARRARVVLNSIRPYQATVSSLEECNKPVISAIHGSCIGGGLNLICAADIRYCSKQAWFQNKEVDIGMVADVGTLQRMPRIVGSSSLVNELAFTARKFDAQEALDCGLVSRLFDSQESLLEGALDTAKIIASKSPVAVQGSKRSIIFSRDHGVSAGLEHIAMHNMSMIQSEDLLKAVTAQMTKEPATFSKL